MDIEYISFFPYSFPSSSDGYYVIPPSFVVFPNSDTLLSLLNNQDYQFVYDSYYTDNSEQFLHLTCYKFNGVVLDTPVDNDLFDYYFRSDTVVAVNYPEYLSVNIIDGYGTGVYQLYNIGEKVLGSFSAVGDFFNTEIFDNYRVADILFSSSVLLALFGVIVAKFFLPFD